MDYFLAGLPDLLAGLPDLGAGRLDTGWPVEELGLVLGDAKEAQR